jgi:hypothetical protein
MKLLEKFALFLVLAAQAALGTDLVGVPQVLKATESSATIQWKTDVESGSVVKFGTDAANLIRKASGNLGAEHNVVLENLQPGTTYHYEVGTAKRGLGKYSFTTPGKSTAAPKALPAAQEENKPLMKRLFGFFGGDTETEQKADKPAEPKKLPTTQKPLPTTKPAAAAAESTAVKQAPATRDTWGDLASLEDHYVRHGKDFKSKSADEYAAQAWQFLQKALDEGLPVKVESDERGRSTYRVWEAKTRTFAAYRGDFKTRTFFRPSDPTYFDRQPGEKMKLVRKK